MSLWGIIYSLMLALGLAWQARENLESPRHLIWDLGALFPLMMGLLSSEPIVPLLGFQIHALIYLTIWCRQAQRDQSEALTKYALSLLLGVFFLLSTWLLFQEQGQTVIWPFAALAANAGLWYEALGAASLGVGLLLLLGLPPLQQGSLDLLETLDSRQQFRAAVLLKISLLGSLWVFLPFIIEVLSQGLLHLIAGVGLLALCMARLSSSVQMSVPRTFAYQATSLSFALLFMLGLSSERLELPSMEWGLCWTATGLLMLALFYGSYRRHVSEVGWHPHWDDVSTPTNWRRTLRTLVCWDLAQALLATGLAFYCADYIMLSLSLFYGLCCSSLLRDPAAFQARRT